MERNSPLFVEDYRLPEMVHVLTVRSAAASGRLVSLNVPHLPKGYYLIQAQDIPGRKTVKVYGIEFPVLAEDRISYYGEPLALLAGPDPQILRSLFSEIEVKYEEEWPLFSFESFSSDQIVAKRLITRGDVDAAFAQAKRQFEGQFHTPSQYHWSPEPSGAVAVFDYDKLTIHTASQWPFHVRDTVAKSLAISETDVVVQSVPTGTHLDSKIWFPSLVAVHAALAAVVCRRPARLLYSREEDFLYSPKRARSGITLKLSLDAAGRLDALEAQILLDMGAYGVFADEMLERMCVGISGLYNFNSLKVEAYAIKTNNPPLGPFAGFGLSSTAFALESLCAQVISEGDFDPCQFRLTQLVGRSGVKSLAERDKVIEGIPNLFRLVTQASDFSRKFASYELLRKRSTGERISPQRGIGISLTFQGNGFLSKFEESESYSVECVLEKDLSFSILTSAVSSQTGLIDMWRREASEAMGIPLESVRVRSGTTQDVPNSGPATLSRNITIVSDLLEKCMESIKKKRFRDTLPIRVRKTCRPPKLKEGESDASMAFPSVSTCVTVVEVELDESLLEPRVTGIWLAVDGGEVISRARARDTLIRGCLSALDWAQAERLKLIDGKIDAEQLAQLPRRIVSEPPQVRVFFQDTNGKAAPRGIGELPYHAIPAAYAQALAMASGLDCRSLPVDISPLFTEDGSHVN
jgi:CO/xanthine dehydrogenase Mo-binding subunit